MYSIQKITAVFLEAIMHVENAVFGHEKTALLQYTVVGVELQHNCNITAVVLQ